MAYSSERTPLNRIRRILGDTGEDGGVYLVSDEEILAELEVSTFNQTVAITAQGLASRYAQYPDEQEGPGGVKHKWTSRVKNWQDIARDYSNRPDASATARPPRRSLLGQLTNPKDSRIR